MEDIQKYIKETRAKRKLNRDDVRLIIAYWKQKKKEGYRDYADRVAIELYKATLVGKKLSHYDLMKRLDIGSIDNMYYHICIARSRYKNIRSISYNDVYTGKKVIRFYLTIKGKRI